MTRLVGLTVLDADKPQAALCVQNGVSAVIIAALLAQNAFERASNALDMNPNSGGLEAQLSGVA